MPSFTLFRPSWNEGVLIGFGWAACLLVIGVLLLYSGVTLDAEIAQLRPFLAGCLFLTVAGIFAYWSWGRLTLSYTVDRNALSIRWGGVRQTIPIGNIERLIPGSTDDELQIEGVNWLGHHVGKASLAELGDVLFYSAHRTMSEVLFVQTPTLTYAISVPDQVFFAETVQSHQLRGPLFETRQAVHREGPAAQSFWHDPDARLLGTLLVGSFLIVVAYVLYVYPDLDPSIRVRFPALGGIVRLTDKSTLLDIPRTAAGFLAANLVLGILLHSWERMVSYVLLLAGITIQVMLLVAAIVAVA